MVWWHTARRRPPSLPFAAEQRAWLVNVKLKWVKDRSLDSVVAREKHLRPALHLIDLISSHNRGVAPARDLSRLRRRIGLRDVGVTAFLRRFPALFHETKPPDGSPRGTWFRLTDDASTLRREELELRLAAESDLVDRLRRLLMLTAGRSLPLHTIDQLSWDMGLPLDYHVTLLPRHPHLFDLVQPPGDERVWLKLLSWDPHLATSELQKASRSATANANDREECLAFPVCFTRGFGLRRKCLAWLEEWQTLPYTSPYTDASGLDPRTDLSEKRIVGVFHELLHLTIAKKTERKNVSNLRKPLSLPQKFTKVFERHPGIFYLSQKLATQTVVLREAYGGAGQQLSKHPLVGIRERYAAIIRVGMRERSRGASHLRVAEEHDEPGSCKESDESSDFDSDSSSESNTAE